LRALKPGAMANPELLSEQGWLLAVIKRSFTHKILILSTALTLLYSLTIPLATQAIIDRVIVHEGYATLYVIAIAIAVLGLLEALAVTLRAVAGAFLANQYGSLIASDLIAGLAAAPSAQLLGRAGLKRAHIVDEVNIFRQDYMDIVSYVYQSLVPVLFYAVIMFIISPAMSLIVALTVPVYYCAYRLVKAPGKRDTATAIRLRAESSAAVHTMVAAIETVKGYGLSRLFARNIDRLMNHAFYAGFLTARRTAVWQGMSRACNGIAQALILFVGASAVMENTLTLGQLIAFQIFAGRLLEPMTRAGQMMERLQRIRLHLEKWNGQLRDAQRPQALAPARTVPGAPVLELDNVAFRYEHAAHSQLHQVSLSIAAGEIVFLLGPSGSGKSTIVRLASGLLAPTAGSVRVQGNEISATLEADRLALVAAAFQEPVLLPGTLRENIGNFARHDQFDLDEVLAVSGVDEIVGKMPAGLETDLGERGMPLSGGEKQRICLARLLAAAPALLIIDEGTSGLQRGLEMRILGALKARLLPHQAVLIITHREDLASLGTREIRIDDGAVQSDTPVHPKHGALAAVERA
jgi:subfamily B ATP-binding cassette protein HlyB/CyaB